MIAFLFLYHGALGRSYCQMPEKAHYCEGSPGLRIWGWEHGEGETHSSPTSVTHQRHLFNFFETLIHAICLGREEA